MKKKNYVTPRFFFRQTDEDVIMSSGQGVEWDSEWGGLQQ